GVVGGLPPPPNRGLPGLGILDLPKSGNPDCGWGGVGGGGRSCEATFVRRRTPPPPPACAALRRIADAFASAFLAPRTAAEGRLCLPTRGRVKTESAALLIASHHKKLRRGFSHAGGLRQGVAVEGGAIPRRAAPGRGHPA